MKKIITLIILIIIIITIIIFSLFNFSKQKENNNNLIKEILPEEEISEEQNLETEIKLYFIDNTSNILTPEIRKINSKELISNPYNYVLNLLIKGPLEKKYISSIPADTKINNTKFEKGVLYIDLSEEFLNSSGTNSIYSIVETMCQFNEVEKIRLTINGKSENGLNKYFCKNEY